MPGGGLILMHRHHDDDDDDSDGDVHDNTDDDSDNGDDNDYNEAMRRTDIYAHCTHYYPTMMIIRIALVMMIIGNAT